MTTSGLIDGLVDIDSVNQENTEDRYSQNIKHSQEYIILLKEAENYKFELARYQEILEPAYLEQIRKLKEENKIITQEKEFYFDNFTKYQKEIEPKYKEEINGLAQGLSKYEKVFRDLKIEYNDKLFQYQKEAEKHYNAIIKNLKAENEKHISDKERINNLGKECKDYPKEKIIGHEADICSKAVTIEAVEKSNQELRIANEKLRKEASSYQSALGDALNFHLNSSVQLSADINSLQDRLEKYVTALKGSFIKIDGDKIQELYGKYNLDINQHKNDKILMKSVLQRHVLEKILEYIDNYLEIKEEYDPNNSNDSNNQEKYIMDHTDKLISLLEKFYNSHFEQDNNVIKAIPTKIRQQVYGILGEFGFSETCENKKNQYTHPFISSTALELNQLMAGYRYIKNDIKRKNVENIAENLIKDIIRIFKFRLLVQEPKYETLWFQNDTKINPQFMKGQWDDDCLDDYVVDICYFPLIGTELNDSSKSKVCIHAKVFPRTIAPPPPPSSPPLPSLPLPPLPAAKNHPPSNDEPQNSSSIKGVIKGIFDKMLLPTASSSIPSQNSANNDHNSDANKRQNLASSDRSSDPNKRQNSASSDLNKRQNSADSDRNRDPNKRQNSASSDLNKRQNSADSDRSRDPNKRQNSVDSDRNNNQPLGDNVNDGNNNNQPLNDNVNYDNNKNKNGDEDEKANDVDNHNIKRGVYGGNEGSKIENSESQDIDDLVDDGGEYGNDENSQEIGWVAEKRRDTEKDVDKDGKDTITRAKINKKTSRKKKKPGNDFDCM